MISKLALSVSLTFTENVSANGYDLQKHRSIQWTLKWNDFVQNIFVNKIAVLPESSVLVIDLKAKYIAIPGHSRSASSN